MTDTSRPPADPSLGQLVGKMTETVSALVRDEIELAQAQVKEKAKASGLVIGLFAGAGIFALFGLGWVLHTIFLALTGAVAPWLAALIVTLLALLIAAVLVVVAVQINKRAPSPQTKENIQRDIDAFKAGVS